MSKIPLPARLKISTGNGNTSREVVTLQDACEILIDWPVARRGPFYRSARQAVEEAISGKVSPAGAQEAFAAFCDHAGVLKR